MEGADEVLAGAGVDAGLAADGGVDHAEQRGRHVHDPDAAQPGRGDEAAHVGRRTAADRHHGVGAREPGRTQPLPAVGDHRRRSWPPRRRAARGRAPRSPAGPPTARVRAPARPGVRRRPAAPGSRSSTPWPTSTSYGAAPATRIVVMPAASTISRGDLVGRPPVGVDHEGGDGLVDRRPLVEQRLDPAADVAEQQRPRAAEADPLHRVGEPDPQEDHAVPGEQLAGGRVEHRSAAQRQHAVVGGQRLGDRLALEVAEVRLAGLHEDVGDACAPRAPRRRRRCPARSRPRPRRAASPTVVLPAPIGPTRTTRAAHLNLSVSR